MIFAPLYMLWLIYKGPGGEGSPRQSPQGRKRLRNWRGEPVNRSSLAQLA
jgi:hypothetical protein